MISSSSQPTQQQPQPNPPTNLIQACQNLSLHHIKTLLNQGANINQIIYSGGDGWYSGDTNTPLSVAFSYDFKPEQQQKYIDVIQYLLVHGADHGFKVMRGNWSRQRQYSIFEYLQTKILSFSSEHLSIKFLTILSKYGVDINISECITSRKSSNTWHTCLLIKMMERAGLKSRIKELTSLYEDVDVERVRDQRLEKLAMVYNQENKYVVGDGWYIPADYHINKHRYPPPDKQQASQPPKKISINFLQTLITLIPNINTSTGSSSYYNEKQDEYLQKYEQQGSGGVYCGQQISKYFDRKMEQFLTPLHLAIMNDRVEIVRLLLEKGAKLSKCVFTVCKGVYPLEWGERLKEYFVEENLGKLRKYEQKKRRIEQNLLLAQKGTISNKKQTGYASSEEQQDIPEMKQTLAYLKFEIFKAQRFAIQNLPPLEKYVKMSITCMELAQKFKADPEILELLKKYQKQQLQVKENDSQTEYE